ncbi:EexN family lipoprotein [Desulfovibrio porci]|uniref:EexN family lipoprotein n=1 Tax=Desulfovibrio porci TaxID=2605782 RepID=UPI002A81ED21|nr:EexN family lipoprotein [Desulfovibrio porci]MDY3809841.1 EexN family lipoprotein [Desulfovibrio porci]
MKHVLIAAGVAALLLLSGCKEEKEVKTVQWYTEHPAERQTQIDICKNNPGQLKDEPNCVNAIQSFIINSGGSVRDLKLPAQQ